MGSETFCAIDIGTQTFRVAVADIDGNKIIAKDIGLFNSRLGEALSQGRIGKKVKDGIKGLEKIVESHSPRALRACGTEALRRLKNRRPDLFEEFKGLFPFPLDVISPEEEGSLTALGASTCLGIDGDLPLVILDVGGGSTEAIYKDSSSCLVKSIPLGAVSFNEDLLKGMTFLEDPPYSRARKVLATGGTATTLGAILLGLKEYSPQRLRGMEVSKSTISNTIKDLQALSLEERKKVPGLEPERADIIIPGLTVLLKAISYLGTDRVTISDGGLLMGILVDLIKKEFKDHAQLDWRRLYV